MSRVVAAARRFAAVLPEGRALASDVWETRHRAILALLWAHVPAVLLFGMYRRMGPEHSLTEAAPVALFALLAGQARLGRGCARAWPPSG